MSYTARRQGKLAEENMHPSVVPLSSSSSLGYCIRRRAILCLLWIPPKLKWKEMKDILSFFFFFLIPFWQMPQITGYCKHTWDEAAGGRK